MLRNQQYLISKLSRIRYLSRKTPRILKLTNGINQHIVYRLVLKISPRKHIVTINVTGYIRVDVGKRG